MTYEVEVLPRALASIERLPKKERASARLKIESLANDPRPHGSIKIVGQKSSFRLRVGDWRILYDIEDRVLRITVFSVAHRGDVYRRL